MTDYECPSCGGGFPRTAHHGECPWCGEAMDGDHGPTIGAPTQTVPTNRTSTLTDSAGRFCDGGPSEPIRDDLRVRRNSRDTLLESEL